MKKFKLNVMLALAFSSSVAFAQKVALKVGDNPATINISAILDAESTTKGFLPPRLTTAQRNAIANPSKGLFVYNLTLDCLEINKGTTAAPTWECIGASAAPSVIVDCNATGFAGEYVAGLSLSASSNFYVSIVNNSLSAVTIPLQTSDLVLSGVSGLTPGAPSVSTLNIPAGQSATVTYPITGTVPSCGKLTGVWTKLALSCTKIQSVKPLLTCGSGTWVSLVPAVPTTLTNGVSYSGTYRVPYTNGGCIISETQTVNGLTLSINNASTTASGNLDYTLSGTYTGATGGNVSFSITGGTVQ